MYKEDHAPLAKRNCFPLSLLVLEKMRDIHHRKCEQRGGASECV